MNLEKFLSERLSKEEGKKDNKLTITIPDEVADMINSNDRGNKILRSNIVKFIRSLKSDLEA